MLTRFDLGEGSTLAECQAAAREWLRTVEADVTCVALAWDGYLTMDGERTGALYIDAYEIGQDSGVRVAQRYLRSGRDVTRLGDDVVIRHIEPMVRFRRPPAPPPAVPPRELTGHEQAVLSMMALGMCDDEIAARMGIASPAIPRDVETILRLLGVADRAEAISYYRRGLATARP